VSESLKHKTAKGLFWGALNSGTTQILNLIIGIILARHLTKADYGIIGILTIFTAIAADLQSAGFTQGLINIKRPSARDYNSVFSFNVCMSVLMYVALFLSAPLIASYFHQPCLVFVSRVVFFTFVISSLGIAHGGYMAKNMMNRELAIIGALALIISGTVGITLALLGFAYWSLAWQQVTYMIVVNLGRYYYVRDWRPRLSLDFGPVRLMAPFALKILVTKILNTLSANILTPIFARWFTIHQVGSYTQAFKWNTMAYSLVANTVGQIAQPVLVEDERSDAFRKMLRFTCFLSMPLMFGFALVGREFILITIKEEWLECVPLLQVLCISGAFMPIHTMYQNLAISHGRSDIYMWLNIGQILLQIAVVYAFSGNGMFVMVSAYSAMMILWLLPWHFFTGRLIGYTWWNFFKDIVPFTLTALGTMIVTYYATTMFTNIYLIFVVRCILAAIIYYSVMKLCKVQILTECEQFILKKLKK
jgi:O-antigen/teichoic acid export membrane protein